MLSGEVEYESKSFILSFCMSGDQVKLKPFFNIGSSHVVLPAFLVSAQVSVACNTKMLVLEDKK